MFRDADIFRISRWSADILIGPSVAFGSMEGIHRQSGDRICTLLKHRLVSQGNLYDLRRFTDRWKIGLREANTSDRHLIELTIAAIQTGRLRAYSVTNTPNLTTFQPDRDLTLAALQGSGATAPEPHPDRRHREPKPDQPTRESRIAETLKRFSRNTGQLATWSLETRIAEVVRRSASRIEADTAEMLAPKRLARIVAVLTVWERRRTEDNYALSALVLSLRVHISARTACDAATSIAGVLTRARSAADMVEIDAAAQQLAKAVDEIGVPAFLAAIEKGTERLSSPSPRRALQARYEPPSAIPLSQTLRYRPQPSAVESPECAKAKKNYKILQQAKFDAQFADAAYTEKNERPNIPGYEAVTEEDKINQAGLSTDDLEIPGTNFRAVVYKNLTDNSYVVGYQGTNPLSWSDWKNNIAQGVGFDAARAPKSYYTRAQQIAQDISAASERKGLPKVKFVGHSLGGGLASAAARATGSNATTFNAAGLHAKTVSEVRPGGTITAVYVKGEILTSSQKMFSLPEAESNTVMSLDPPFNKARDLLAVIGGLVGSFGSLAGLSLGVAGGVVIRGIILHLMGSVHECLDRALGEASERVKQICGQKS